jgi:hypothetical protein
MDLADNSVFQYSNANDMRVTQDFNSFGEIIAHTQCLFLTMIFEESVCFMSCEPIFFCNYSYVVHTEYIYIYFFSSTEHCTWAIISPKELKSCVTRISFALLYTLRWMTKFDILIHYNEIKNSLPKNIENIVLCIVHLNAIDHLKKIN